MNDVRDGDVGVDADRRRQRHVRARHLFGDDRVEPVVAGFAAAEALGDLEPEDAGLTGLDPDVARDLVPLDELLSAGKYEPIHELANGLAERLVVGAVQGASHSTAPHR